MKQIGKGHGGGQGAPPRPQRKATDTATAYRDALRSYLSKYYAIPTRISKGLFGSLDLLERACDETDFREGTLDAHLRTPRGAETFYLPAPAAAVERVTISQLCDRLDALIAEQADIARNLRGML
jgi:hypothetical protein